MAAAAAVAMAAPGAAFTLLTPASHALQTSSSPALRGLCGTPVAGSRPRSKLTLFQSGTPLDQAKALPPLDLTEENVTKALEEAKDVLGEASLRVSAYLDNEQISSVAKSGSVSRGVLMLVPMGLQNAHCICQIMLTA